MIKNTGSEENTTKTYTKIINSMVMKSFIEHESPIIMNGKIMFKNMHHHHRISKKSIAVYK